MEMIDEKPAVVIYEGKPLAWKGLDGNDLLRSLSKQTVVQQAFFPFETGRRRVSEVV